MASDRIFALQPESSLLSLPSELRNQIYILILTLQPIARTRFSPAERVVRGRRLMFNVGGGFQEQNQDTAYIITLRPKRYDLDGAYRAQPHRALDILLTCRQIYSDAEKMFYGLNHLRYDPEEVPLKSKLLGKIHLDVPRSFISSLSAKRRQALLNVSLNASSAEVALQELKFNLLPQATGLSALYIILPLDDFKFDAQAIKWATEVQAALRITRVKEVRVFDSTGRDDVSGGLVPGGAGNNSYVIIHHRARWHRTVDLAEMIEGMLNKAVTN